MTYSINEAFCDNMLGKTVKFDVQPYVRGTGTIVKCEPRKIGPVKGFDIHLGTTFTTYEVFDILVLMTEGVTVGALSAGVPVPGTIHDLKGKHERVSGVSYGQLYRATDKGETIVIARCG